MGSLLNSAIAIGPIVLGIGILLALLGIVVVLLRPGPKAGISLPRFLVRLLVVAAGSFAAGTALGIALFCSSASSGDLCGLGGIFGVGPLLSGACVGAYSMVWVRSTRPRAPDTSRAERRP